jgi:hypothetical protein
VSQTELQVEDSPMTRSLLDWLGSSSARKQARRTRRRSKPRRASLPQFLVLEDRTVLSTLIVLNNADSGAGSLRDTLAAAQSGDTIVFDPSLTQETITLNSGPIALSSNLTIDGPGANLLAISGNSASQLFTLSGSAQVTIANLTLTGGMASKGGAILIDGTAALTLDSDILSGNQAVGDANGGAVDNYQTMTIANSLFTGNSAVAGPMADGIHTVGQALGGAIFTGDGIPKGVTVILTLSNSIVAGNEAIGGSNGSTLIGVTADAAGGGGILNLLGGTLNVAGCTITGNQAIAGASASGNGGLALGAGILNYNRCTLNLTNSTVSTNLCQGGAGASGFAGDVATGAGIDNERGSIAILTNSTISLNESVGGAGGAGANGGTGLGGGIFVGNRTAFLEAALVSGNQAQGGLDGQQNTTGNGLGGGVYVDPSASATADMQTLIMGNQASKSNKDVWGNITIVP